MVTVDEVAPVAEVAVVLVNKCATHFGFVLRVEAIVAFELVGAVGKFAVALVTAVPKLHKFAAELGFLLIFKCGFGGSGR
jgi:hypothetical protein